MKIRRAVAIFLVVLLGVVSLVWAEDPIQIGFQGPITGAWAVEGGWALNSVQIVVDLINAQGGILGRPIQLVVEDDSGTPKGGVMAAQKLVSDGVKFVVGSYGSSICLPSSDIYEEGGTLAMNYGCTAVNLSARDLQYYFRSSGRDDAQANYFAQTVVPMFGATRVAIMHDNTAYAKGVAEDTKTALAPMIDSGEVELVYYDGLLPGERDYTPVITSLRDADPDIWYYTGYYPEWGLLLGQGKDMGLDWTEIRAVGSNACPISEVVNLAGADAVAGAMITQEPLPAFLPYPKAVEFVNAYVEKHGSIHDSPWATYAADAVYAMAFAIEKAGSADAEAVAALLHSGEVVGEGITGELSFSPEGDRLGIPYTLLIATEAGETALFDPAIHGHLVGIEE